MIIVMFMSTSGTGLEPQSSVLKIFWNSSQPIYRRTECTNASLNDIKDGLTVHTTVDPCGLGNGLLVLNRGFVRLFLGLQLRVLAVAARKDYVANKHEI